MANSPPALSSEPGLPKDRLLPVKVQWVTFSMAALTSDGMVIFTAVSSQLVNVTSSRVMLMLVTPLNALAVNNTAVPGDPSPQLTVADEFPRRCTDRESKTSVWDSKYTPGERIRRTEDPGSREDDASFAAACKSSALETT